MSTPTWKLTIPKGFDYLGDTGEAYVIAGTGQPPVAELIAPPPGDPADPPPVRPPVEDPFAPQPGEDVSAFVFPTDGPRYQTRDFDRNYPLDRDGTLGADYLACEQDAGNPSIMSHVNAGIIAAGGTTAYGRAVAGLRLWVRTRPGESMTGQPIPPAPAHLIRRALAKGRL